MAMFIPIGLSVVIVAGAIAFVIWHAQKTRAAFIAALKNDPDVEVAEGWQPSVKTRRPPLVSVVPAGGGKNNPHRWDLVASAPRTGRRTSLSLSREGLSGSLRELVGFKDVHIGDAAFDKEFTLRAGEPDAARGIVSNGAVRAAVHAFFDLPAWRVEVRGDAGVVTARCPRGDLDAAQAKRAVLALQQLVEALEQHADDPAVREPIATAVSGSATGAPVGVPIGGR